MKKKNFKGMDIDIFEHDNGQLEYADEKARFLKTGNTKDDVWIVDRSNENPNIATHEIKPLFNDQFHLGGNSIGVSSFTYSSTSIKDLTVPIPGDPHSWTPYMWSELVRKNNINSVLDVGSGLGYSAAWFRIMGLDVTAIDGLPFNVKNAVYPTIEHDLTQGPFITEGGYDLVWSCEVAEHIDEKYIDFFLQTVTNCKVLAMTAAPPEDGGHHHVNCRNIEYWIEKIEKDYGMKYNHIQTVTLQRIAYAYGPRSDSHFKRNGMIFCR